MTTRNPFDAPAAGTAVHGTPAVPLREPGDGTDLWLVRVTEYAPAADESLFDDAERQRAAAFLRQADRDRYRVAHTALRRLLGGYLGTGPAEVGLVREPCPGCGRPHGRPAVAKASARPGVPLHFSLSHAGDLVLLAFAGTPVGADVEELPSAATAEAVAASLHPEERAELAALPGSARPAAFARCWTRKEAYLKGTGIGLGEDPSVTYVGTGASPAPLAGWEPADVPVPPGYAAACAVRRPGSPAPTMVRCLTALIS